MTAENGHWMPIYWADYFADTTHLSTEEHGAYFLLIGTYWRRGGPLPAVDSFLASAAKVSRQRWACLKTSLAPFFEIDGVSWTHKRVELEILKSCSRISSAQAKANARWHPQEMLSTTTKKDKILFNGGGKKNGNGHTIRDPQERLNRFQKALAEAMGRDGYSIVGAAQDPSNPLYARSLALCKAKAQELGKGWPHHWPKCHS